MNEARAALNAAMSERELQNTIEEALDRFNWRWFHYNDAALAFLAKEQKYHLLPHGQAKGLPDIIAVKDGKLVVLELKKAGGRTKPEQNEWLDALSEVVDAEVRIVRPADLDETLALLEGTDSWRQTA